LGDWKGVRLNAAKKPDGPIELYHLSTDLAEEVDLADQYPDIVARMAAIMAGARNSSKNWPWPGDPV
jgi:hypothetical protein